MKKFEKLGILLSAVCAINLALSFCISQASTDVVWVQPQGNTSGEFTSDMGYVAQSFTATADTIKTASFFCGKERPTGNYYGYINTSPTPGGTSAYGSSAGKKYQDVIFTFNVPVTRGQRYYFVVQHTGGGSPQGLEYYYREGTAYLYGSLYVSGTQDTSHDLCARVVGTGKVLDVWGQNPYIVWGWWKGVATSESTLDICQGEGVTYIREQIPWGMVQPTADTLDPAFSWGASDSMMKWASAKGLKVVWNTIQSPWWASTKPQPDTCIPPDSQIVSHPPKGLYNPVFVNGQINTQNPFGYYVWKIVKRYGNGGSNNYGNPVQYWEIWNEANSLSQWDYPDTTQYNITYGDSLGLLRLYERAVEVAYEAIKGPYGADTQGKILIAGLERVHVGGKYRSRCTPYDSIPGHPYLGKWWLDQFLADGGGQWIDVYGFHPYQYPASPPPWGRAWVDTLKMDVDTLRKVLRTHGQGSKPLWANEVGWGASQATLTRQKQADNFVQFHTGAIEQGTNPNGPLDKLMWYQIRDEWPWNDDYHSQNPDFWWGYAGTVDSTLTPKAMHYAAKQMNIKLKDKYFNRQVPVGSPSDSVYCFEFQIPGSDTCRKTWAVWKTGNAVLESISVRTSRADSVKIAYSATLPDSGRPFATTTGRIKFWCDSMPFYFTEVGAISRPDVIVDSLFTYPSYPKAGDKVWFYARIKNISTTDSVKAALADTVIFQVDGATEARYKIRGLAPGDTVTVGCFPYPPPLDAQTYDWQANYGDHLIRAWADSADRFVELNEANNMAYIQRHIAPSGKVIIPTTGYNQGYPTSGRKFSNVRPVKLSTEGNGSTIPFPDSVRIMNSWEGSWRPWRGYADSYWDTLSTGDEMKWVSAQWKMASGETSATVVDSIVLDETAPVAYIATPTDSETVSETVTFWGSAHDYYAHFRVDTLRYFRSASQYGIIQVSTTPIGEMMMGELGAWNTYSVNDGWTHETLAVWDSAGNQALTQVTLYVDNADPGDGDGFAAGFGSFGSSPMNVATDPGGNLYVAETQGSKVRKYSPKKDSLFAFSARRGNDTTGLSWAVGMAVKDSTTLWIADGYNHCLKRFDREGNLLFRFGSYGQDTSQFRQPAGVALDPKRRLWVCDRLNHRVQVFDSTGKFLFKFGSQGSDSTQFNSPTGIAITPKGLVYVSDTKNNRIQVFDSTGKFVKVIVRPDSLGFDTPLGICSDKRGNIYVADGKHHRVVKLNPFGQRLFVFGKEGDSLCQFKNPIGVAASPGAHYLYVADAGNRRVTRFTVIRGDTTGGGPQAGAGVQVLPLVYELGPAIPNPSKGQTTFRYALPKESVVNLKIYNVAGQMVREFNQGKQKAGYYSITWDGRNNQGYKVGPGVYFYRLQAGNWAKTRKMVVIR